MATIFPNLDIALPHPDVSDPHSMLLGVLKRFAFRPPDPDPDLLTEFESFVTKFVEENLEPLSPNTDLSVDTWLASTKYSESRKQELRETHEKLRGVEKPFLPIHTEVKEHMKAETYPEYKYPRPINARHDFFKVLIGPIIKQIEKVVMKMKHFIKYVPVKDRPKFIMDRLYRDFGKYFASDFTSFEAQFTRKIMLSCEMILYRHMTKKLPPHIQKNIEIIAGKNKIKYKWFDLEIEASRMSGEMNTSLGNGFSNLMILLFMFYKSGCTNVDAIVEGDDGVLTFEGVPPTAADFARLGFVIKPEYHTDISAMSFCGLIFDMFDLVNITEPISSVINLCWLYGPNCANLSRTKMLALMRCKALSMAHQYPGCPILQEMAFSVLRQTEHVSKHGISLLQTAIMNNWEKEQVLQALEDLDLGKLVPKPVPRNTRHLMESKFGIPVSVQLSLEAMFRDQDFFDWDFRQMKAYCHPHWLDYGARYTRVIKKGFSNAMVSFPTGFPPKPVDLNEWYKIIEELRE